ncbi:MAG TPA: hypothetical protein VLJ39_01900 [Tepidisphaeraceae bacterium]|nr:hypothetical protein [Tepidisphaeraceae bacterium]
MGQAANNRGRNASLDEKKSRSAGRGLQGSAPDFDSPAGRGKTLGAFGNSGKGRGGKAQPSKKGNAGAPGKAKR